MVTTEQELRRPDVRAVAEALEPEAGLLADADPLGFAGALMQFTGAVVRDPIDTAPVGLRWGIRHAGRQQG